MERPKAVISQANIGFAGVSLGAQDSFCLFFAFEHSLGAEVGGQRPRGSGTQFFCTPKRPQKIVNPPCPSPQQHVPPPPFSSQDRTNRESPEEAGQGEREPRGEVTRQGRPRGAERRRRQRKGQEKESLWLSEALVRKIILQMHTPARTSQCWSRQTQHGLRVCIWMHLVNGTGSIPSLGQPTPESSNRTSHSGAQWTQPEHLRTHRGSECAVARGQ
jgi:hypothetical protein